MITGESPTGTNGFVKDADGNYISAATIDAETGDYKILPRGSIAALM
jgi:hypothetical protein